MELKEQTSLATNGLFHTFIEKNLLPQLKPKHIAMMDNVKFHLQARMKETLESSGAKVIFLPLYSPDLRPHRNHGVKNKQYVAEFSAMYNKKF